MYLIYKLPFQIKSDIKVSSSLSLLLNEIQSGSNNKRVLPQYRIINRTFHKK